MTEQIYSKPARPANPPDIIVQIFVDRTRRGGDGAPAAWSATLDGEPLITREKDPEHAACRALMARGLRGRVGFQHATGTIGMVMDIEKGAGRAVSENDAGIQGRKYEPFHPRESARTGELPSGGTEVPADDPARLGGAL